MTSSTEAYILLTLPNVFLQTRDATETGQLTLECISPHDASVTSEDAKTNKAVYLVFHLNEYILPIEPAIPISLKISQTGDRTYTFHPITMQGRSGKDPIQEVSLTIPIHTQDTHLIDTVEAFDHILTEYAELRWEGHNESPPAPSYEQAISSGMPIDHPELRGKLVLMDELSGQVVGELPQGRRLKLTEDSALAQTETGKDGHGEAAPVVLELPPDVYDACTGQGVLIPEGEELVEARDIFVRAVPREEQDWLTTSATFISQAISSSTSLLISGLNTASSYYISKSAPYNPPTPTPSSSRPTPHPALSQAHVLSEKAAWASARTADFVGGLIKHAVGRKTLAASASGTTTPGNGNKSTPPPNPTPLSTTPSSSKPPTPPPRKPLRTRDRFILSANLLLATVDDSGKRLLDASTDRLGAVVGHKYGSQAQKNTNAASGTARNIVLVYIDMRGFARKALIKRAGKEWIKAKVGSKNAKGSTEKTA
ncbi:hypothetical protein ABKN59_009831 [Abortiporus biennis]